MDIPRISLKERADLFNNVVKFVVNIETQIKPHKPRVCGGGVIVNEKGFVLTSALVVPKGYSSIHCSRYGTGGYSEYELVKKKEDLGLAILRPKSLDLNTEYAEFSEDNSLHAAMEIFSVSHPSQMEYSFVVGQLAYNGKTNAGAASSQFSCRTVRELVVKDVKKFVVEQGGGNDLLSVAHANVSLIQLNNLHGAPESFGSPVFNSRGQIIGIYSLVHNFIDYAIHVAVLQKFCEKYLKEEKGEGSKSASQRKKQRT